MRLEIDTTMPDSVHEVLGRELEVDETAVTVIDGPLDLSGLWGLYGLDRPELKDEPWTPQTQHALLPTDGRADMFRILQQGDVLVHHPYDSFATSVEAFVEQAAQDPRVLAIKQTIYRTAGTDSTIVGSLVRAAREGKQVVALVELKARFDEQANIERARVLEEAGVHVVYGLVGLKTHAKILLVVRQEDDGIRRYCHVGTGNYNPKTATLYEDFGLLTADPKLGAELTELFNHLTGYSRPVGYQMLLVAPESLRRGLTERIRAQAALGANGRIIMKMNSLVDPDLIDELYDASRAGTPIDLIVRGICCLRPQFPDQSATIRVRSIGGAVPGTLPRLPLRCRSGDRRLVHRFRGSHAPQPRPAGRSARPRPRLALARPARRDHRARAGRHRARMGAATPRGAGLAWPANPP